MSAYARVQHWLQCDWKGCQRSWGPAEATVHALRRDARRNGWAYLYRPSGRTREDRCPFHKDL